VTDHFGASVGGRPLELERSFDSLSAEPRTRSGSGEDAEDRTETSAASSRARASSSAGTPTSRATTRSTRPRKAPRAISETARGPARGHGICALCCRTREVAADDEWKVDGSAFAGRVCGTAASCVWRRRARRGRGTTQRELELEALEHLGGEINATYKGRREVGGRSMGSIHVEAELETKSDAESCDDDGSLVAGSEPDGRSRERSCGTSTAATSAASSSRVPSAPPSSRPSTPPKATTSSSRRCTFEGEHADPLHDRASLSRASLGRVSLRR
jgi:hypothetical protein